MITLSQKFHLPGLIGCLVVTIKLKGKENFALCTAGILLIITLYNSIQNPKDTEVSVTRVSPTYKFTCHAMLLLLILGNKVHPWKVLQCQMSAPSFMKTGLGFEN